MNKRILVAALLLSGCAAAQDFAPGPAPEQAAALAPALQSGPMYPVFLKAPDGSLLATIEADGTITGNRGGLVALLRTQTGPVNEQSILAALIARELGKK